MKRNWKILLISAILTLVFVVSAVNVFAASPEAQGLIDAGFAEDFAEALVKNGVTAANYSTFAGEIDASNQGITDITGINKLLHARKIDLTYNNISDITPIMLDDNTDYYDGYIDLRFNPINKYPTSKKERKYVFNFKENQSFSIETGRWFGKELNILNSGTPQKFKVDFDVTLNGHYWWNTSDAEDYDVAELYPYIAQKTGGNQDLAWDYSEGNYLKQESSDGLVSWDYEFAGRESSASGYGMLTMYKSGFAQVRAPYEEFGYHCPWDGSAGSSQGNSQEFRYLIKIDAYSPLKENVTATVLGGIAVTKTDSKGNKLAGAEFGLFTDESCSEESKVDTKTTDANGEIYWDNLPVGKVYYVKELSAPKGYFVADDPVKVTVTDGGKTASLGTFDGGYSEVKFVYSGDPIEVTPDWSGERHDPIETSVVAPENEYDLTVLANCTESLKPSGDVVAYIKNGGKTVNTFKIEGVSGLTLNSSDLKLKLSSKDDGQTVESPAKAREIINGLINNNGLTYENDVIELSGEVKYSIPRSSYNKAEFTDKSICIFIEPIADKKLVGRAIEGGEFGFVLVGADCNGDVSFEGTNAAAEAGEDTTVVEFFDAEENPAVLRFCEEGTYKFTLNEVIPEEGEEGMVYDGTTYEVVVEVKETGTEGLLATLKVNGKTLCTISSANVTLDDEGVPGIATVNLCTIVNRFTERENPKTGVPTLFSLVDLFTLAGLGIVLKKRFF